MKPLRRFRAKGTLSSYYFGNENLRERFDPFQTGEKMVWPFATKLLKSKEMIMEGEVFNLN